MNTFLTSYLLVLIIPAFVAGLMSPSFYRLRTRYPLYLAFQTGLLVLLLSISFKEQFPLHTTSTFFNHFELSFLFDDVNVLFLTAFMVSLCVLLLRIVKEERESFTILLLSAIGIWLSGNFLTLFIAGFFYFLSLLLENKKQALPLIISYLPLILFFMGFFQIMVQNVTSSHFSFHNSDDYFFESTLSLCLLFTAFIIPVLNTLRDYLSQPSTCKNDVKLSLTLFTALYIIWRFCGFVQDLNNSMIIYFFVVSGLIYGLSMFIVITKEFKQNALVPFILLFFFSFTLFLLGLEIIHPASFTSFPEKTFLYSLPLYATLIILYRDGYPSVKDGYFKYFSFIFLISLILFNPWFSMGQIIIKTIVSLLNTGFVGFLFFILFLLLSFMSAFFLLISDHLNSRREEVTSSWFLFTLVLILLIFIEGGYIG
jgi:hypothetical protein